MSPSDSDSFLAPTPRAPLWRALLLGSVAALALTGARPALAQSASSGAASSGAATSSAGSTDSASAPVQLPTVSVEGSPDADNSSGYKADQPGIPKLTGPLVDTPQTIDAVPRQLMDDQGDTTLRDALRNVPGISLAAGEFSAQGDNLTIRGFSARSDIFLDGMRDYGSYYRDPFDLQDVQVLKGPSSILFGRGSTGGVVEQDGKQAQLAPVTAGSVALGTDLTKRITTDFDRALPEFGPGAAIRLNAMADDGGVAGRDDAHNTRGGVAPSLAFGLGTPTRLTIDYLHQSEYDIPDYGVPVLYPAAASGTQAKGYPVSLSAVGSNAFYGFEHGDYLRTNVDIPTIKLEHDFNDNVTGRDQARYGYYQRQFRITEPQLGDSSSATSLSPGQIAAGTPLSSLQVYRNELAGSSIESSLENQSDVTATFKTGMLDHTAVAGVELDRETSDPERYTTDQPYSTTPLTDPDPDQIYNASTYYASSTKVTATTEAAYALDTVKLGDHWQVMGGGRFDRMATDYFQQTFNNPTTGTGAGTTSLSRTDNMPSWRGALVYKPALNGTVYVDGGTSFDPSAEQLSLSASTAGLAPEKNISSELGTKWEFFDSRLGTQGALFRTEQLNVRETDPNNTAQMILAGDAVAEGVELQTTGRITRQWQVEAGYAYTYSAITKSPTTGPSSDLGHRLGNVPEHTFNLWSTYTLPDKLQFGGGMNYVSDRFTGSTPTTVGGAYYWKDVPGYVVFNAMAKYPVNDHLTFQLNGYNLTNAKYYDEIHPSHIVPGAGPSALFTTSFSY